MPRQNWRTPPSVFLALQEYFGEFDHDIAADDANHLCASYSTEKDGPPSAGSWGERNWGNIPFGNPRPFMHAAMLADLMGKESVILTHANANSPWFITALERAELFCPDKRLNFWHPAESAPGADRDTVVWHFGGTPGRVSSIAIPEHRKEVKRLITEAKGQQSWL